MSNKIGIIVNPNSKLNKQNPQIPQKIREIVGDQADVSITKSFDEVYEIAQKYKNNGIEILCLNGGDGTIASTLSIFIKVYGDQPLPKILILPGGTINVLAKNLRLKGGCLKTLTRFMGNVVIPKQEPVIQTYSSLKIDDNYGFLYADGVGVNFLELFYKNKTNAIGSAALVVKLLASSIVGTELFKSVCYQNPINLEAKNNDPIKHNSSMIMAATVEKIPYGIPMFKELKNKTNLIQFFSVTSTPKQVLYHFPSLLLRSNNTKSKGKFGFCCEELKLTTDKNYKYTLDGELFTADSNSITIGLGPKINFVVV